MWGRWASLTTARPDFFIVTSVFIYGLVSVKPDLTNEPLIFLSSFLEGKVQILTQAMSC